MDGCGGIAALSDIVPNLHASCARFVLAFSRQGAGRQHDA